jgi:acyl carrier protein
MSRRSSVSSMRENRTYGLKGGWGNGPLAAPRPLLPMAEDPGQRTATHRSTDAEAVAEVVNRVIRRCALEIPRTVAITPDLELLEAGVNSLTLVEIIAGLETEFDYTFPDDLITLDVFRTPASIASTVIGLISGAT